MSNIEVWVHDCPNSGKREAMPRTKSCVGCGAQPEWDASQGANPDTCLHMLAHLAYVPGPSSPFRVCVSCNSTLDPEYWGEFVWDYEIESGIYKRRSIAETRRARHNEKVAKRIIGSDFEWVDTVWPRIFKLGDKYFVEDFDIDADVERFTQIHPDLVEGVLSSRGIDWRKD